MPGQPSSVAADRFSLWSIRVTALFGAAISFGVFVLVAYAPDQGPTSVSIRQGLALAVVFATAHGTLLAPANSSLVASLGGGMVVAGVSTIPGGNPAGLIMIVPGVLLILGAALHHPELNRRVIGQFLLVAPMLALGVYLALDTSVFTGLGALVTAIVVASSGRWSHVVFGDESVIESKSTS